MRLGVTILDSVARAGRATLGLISWRAMPLVVRLLFAVLFSIVVIVAIQRRDRVAGVCSTRSTR